MGWTLGKVGWGRTCTTLVYDPSLHTLPPDQGFSSDFDDDGTGAIDGDNLLMHVNDSGSIAIVDYTGFAQPTSVEVTIGSWDSNSVVSLFAEWDLGGGLVNAASFYVYENGDFFDFFTGYLGTAFSTSPSIIRLDRDATGYSITIDGSLMAVVATHSYSSSGSRVGVSVTTQDDMPADVALSLLTVSDC